MRRIPALRLFATAVAVTVISIVGWLGTRRSRAATPARDSAVVALHQRGTRAYDRRTSAGVVEAVASFRAALARDSTYIAAWTGLAKSYVRAYQRTFVIPGVSRDSVLLLAIAAADRALSADSMNAEAWVSRALATRFVDPTDLTMTLRAVRRALVLDSSMATGWHTLAITLADVGDLKGATDAWRRCIRMHPAHTECLAFLGQAHYWQRNYDSAAVWADSAIAVDPSYLLGRQVSGNVEVERGNLLRAAAAFEAARRLVTDVELVNGLAGSALVEARAGRNREAKRLLRQADSLARFYIPPQLHTVVYLAQAHAALGEADQANAVLTRFEPRRDLHFQLHLRCDPPLDPLRPDQGFQSLILAPAPAGC
jgi:Tfp pilus assembly protein PilF